MIIDFKRGEESLTSGYTGLPIDLATGEPCRSRRAALGRVANAELSGPGGPLERLVFRKKMRNCDALRCASRTSRSNGNGLRSQTSRVFRSGHSAQLRVSLRPLSEIRLMKEKGENL